LKKRFFVLALCLLLSLTACGMRSGSDDGLSEDQELRLTIPLRIKRFDSATSDDAFTQIVLNNTFEGLTRLNHKNRPVPGMAEKVSVSPDRTTYTFTLREAFWSDGEPVTAHDFEYAWKRALAPENDSPNAHLFFPIVNARQYHEREVSPDKVGIKALDDKTLEVRLLRPVRHFLTLTAMTPFLPQRKDIVRAAGKKFAENPTKLAYNGPFAISRVTDDGTIILQKNEQYWDRQNVRLETIRFYVANHPVRNMNLYNAGLIDVTRVGREFAEAYAGSQELHVVHTSSTQYIRFNFDKLFFRNKKIRQAINLAIDRKKLIETLHNGAEPAAGLIPPTMEGNRQSFRQEVPLALPETDPAKARQLFREGLAELGLSRPPSGIIMLSYSDDRMMLAVEIKEQLRNTLGLNILLNTTSRSEKRSLERKGEFGLALSDWAATYPDPSSYLETFTTDHPINTGNYSDAPYDETIRRALYSDLVDRQMSYLAQAERFLVKEDYAIVPLYTVNDSFLVKPYVKGLIRHPFGAPYTFKWVWIEKH
jgi:oligopeptide transport system substrate-binding protein